jgi:hypothetical protein
MKQVLTIQDLELTSSPYITAYLASLLSFVESLDMAELGLQECIPLFKHIVILGAKSERNQQLNDFLFNNSKGHLEVITKMLSFPMTLGVVEHHELNTAFNEACGYLRLVPFSLMPSRNIKQAVIGSRNIVLGSVTGSTIITGDGNIHIGDNFRV